MWVTYKHRNPTTLTLEFYIKELEERYYEKNEYQKVEGKLYNYYRYKRSLSYIAIEMSFSNSTVTRKKDSVISKLCI